MTARQDGGKAETIERTVVGGQWDGLKLRVPPSATTYKVPLEWPIYGWVEFSVQSDGTLRESNRGVADGRPAR